MVRDGATAPPHHEEREADSDCKHERPAMNFDDTPQEAAFRAEARNWIDANAPKQFEAELSSRRSAASSCRSTISSMSPRPGKSRRRKAAGFACTGQRNTADAARARSNA